MPPLVYIVKVFHGSQLLDETTVAVGSWHRIGHWLDDYGYIDPGYRIEVTMEYKS